MEEPLPIALDLSPTDATFNFNFNPTSTRSFNKQKGIQNTRGGAAPSDSNSNLNLASNLGSNLNSNLGLNPNLDSNLEGEASLDFGVCVDPFLQLDSPLENGYLAKNGAYV
jgi:hypothetical protein